MKYVDVDVVMRRPCIAVFSAVFLAFHRAVFLALRREELIWSASIVSEQGVHVAPSRNVFGLENCSASTPHNPPPPPLLSYCARISSAGDPKL